MNVDKIVYTDPVQKCDYGIQAVYINLCKKLLMKSILMMDKIAVGIQVVK